MCQCETTLTSVRPPGRPRVSDDPEQRAKHMRCLFYRVLNGLTVRQVADLMDVSEATVKLWTKLALSYHGYPEIRKVREMIEASGKAI